MSALKLESVEDVVSFVGGLADKISDLAETVDKLTLKIDSLESVDRALAEREKTRRWEVQESKKADRWKVVVKYQGGRYVLLSNIEDPVKFRDLMRGGVLRKKGGFWVVMVDIAQQKGYTVYSANGEII